MASRGVVEWAREEPGVQTHGVYEGNVRGMSRRVQAETPESRSRFHVVVH